MNACSIANITMAVPCLDIYLVAAKMQHSVPPLLLSYRSTVATLINIDPLTPFFFSGAPVHPLIKFHTKRRQATHPDKYR